MPLHHRIDGPENGTPLILGPSLGTSTRLWEHQLGALTRTHRVLRFDLPGHGGSPVPPGASSVSALAALVLELADRQGWHRFHYAGVSLGGAIGARLAVDEPARVASLAMICSSARFGEPSGWLERAATVRAQGTAALADGSRARWFAAPPAPGTLGETLLEELASVTAEGYAACCEALSSYDVRRALPSIGAPTLIVAGREDPATPPPHGRELAGGIDGATLVEVPHASHLALVDRPEAVTAALLAHLGTASDDDRHGRGMKVRRAVLGDAHVDRSIARTTDFTADFQDFITRYAWGEIWTRPGLDRRTRSCITLTALIARGHHEELAMHVRAALTNGLTREEIKEVLLQSAVYCGVPAANSAFAIAQRVLDEAPEHP